MIIRLCHRTETVFVMTLQSASHNPFSPIFSDHRSWWFFRRREVKKGAQRVHNVNYFYSRQEERQKATWVTLGLFSSFSFSPVSLTKAQNCGPRDAHARTPLLADVYFALPGKVVQNNILRLRFVCIYFCLALLLSFSISALWNFCIRLRALNRILDVFESIWFYFLI